MSDISETSQTSRPAPSPWVLKYGPRIPRSETVLDLACGSGRHARWFHANGYGVLAVDRDISKVADMADTPNFQTLEYDLEADFWPFGPAQFGGIVVTNYLHRPLFPHLTTCLKPGGILIYETFAQGHEQFGRPNNRNFLLRKGELQLFFSRSLEVIDYEGVVDMANGPAVRQRICARKPI